MSLSITTRWLRRPVVAAALIATGLLAGAGATAPAEAQYYPYYGYNPYYSAYCNPYYYPYGCAPTYAYPSYGYGYPVAYGYGYGYGFGGFHRGFGGGFRRGGGFHGGGGRGGGGRGGGGHHH